MNDKIIRFYWNVILSATHERNDNAEASGTGGSKNKMRKFLNHFYQVTLFLRKLIEGCCTRRDGTKKGCHIIMYFLSVLRFANVFSGLFSLPLPLCPPPSSGPHGIFFVIVAKQNTKNFFLTFSFLFLFRERISSQFSLRIFSFFRVAYAEISIQCWHFYNYAI